LYFDDEEEDDDELSDMSDENDDDFLTSESQEENKFKRHENAFINELIKINSKMDSLHQQQQQASSESELSRAGRIRNWAFSVNTNFGWYFESNKKIK
jgi:hypothetical protein